MTKQKKSEVTQSNATPLVAKHEKLATHRYYCDSCTGVAFFYSKLDAVPSMVKCGKCGKENAYKESNLIPLSVSFP